jgi:hypothetical protein
MQRSWVQNCHNSLNQPCKQSFNCANMRLMDPFAHVARSIFSIFFFNENPPIERGGFDRSNKHYDLIALKIILQPTD